MKNNNRQFSEIILHLQNPDEILSISCSPSYRRRMLNEDIEEFIIEEAASFPRRSRINLKIYLPSVNADLATELEAAVCKHFNYRREKALKQLKQTLKLGLRSLLIAFLFLGVILSITELADQIFPENRLAHTISESLIILGWVAFWRPAELLLYDWSPIKREAELYGRLSECNTEVFASADHGMGYKT